MPTTRSQARRGAPRAGGSMNNAARRNVTKPSKKPSKRKAPAPKTEPSTSAQVISRPKRRKSSSETPSQPSQLHTVAINRAPVLTLWAAVVSQRQGFSYNEGLTFGKWISGILAQSKGRSLGIYEKKERTEAEKAARRRRDESLGIHTVDAFGMHVPAMKVQNELHAASEGKAIEPGSVESYLERSFGGSEILGAAKAAMEALAQSVPADEIGKQAYHFYEQIRPEWKGWGQKGHLNLDGIRELAAQHDG